MLIFLAVAVFVAAAVSAGIGFLTIDDGPARVKRFVTAGALVAVGVVALLANNAMKYRAAEVWLAARAAGDDLQTRVYSGFGPYGWDVQAALNKASRPGSLKVQDRGRNGMGADQYEVTNSDGKYPVCLTISKDVPLSTGPTTVRADVEDGPCPPPGSGPTPTP